MLKDQRLYRYGFIFILLVTLVPTIFSQDLGSSSGLFGNPKPKKTEPRAVPKKAAPKAKPVSAKKTPPKPRATLAAKRAALKARIDAKNALLSKKTKEKSPETVADTTTVAAPNGEGVAEDAASVAESPKLFNAKPSGDIVITVGDKSSGDFNEIYEKSIEEGNAERDRRNYIKAEAAYLRAQNLQGKDARAVYGLGNLYSDQQRWEEAERAYRAALEIDPTATESYIALSYVLTQPIIGVNLADRYMEAEKLARKAIELDPKNAFAYDQLGVALELGGKISVETQTNYRRAIELEPNFALAYAHLGRLLIKTGMVDESAAAYSQSIKLAADVPTMILVADVMQSQQKFAESEQLLLRALKEDEKNPTALYLLGRALTIRGAYDEAEKVLKKSAEIIPNSFVAYTLLGSMAARRGSLKDAENYLMQASRVVSLNEKKRLAQEFEAVGDGYLKKGKRADAARVYRQAVTLDKDKVVLREKLAGAQ